MSGERFGLKVNIESVAGESRLWTVTAWKLVSGVLRKQAALILRKPFVCAALKALYTGAQSAAQQEGMG